MPITCSIEGRIVHVLWQGTIVEEDLDALAQSMPGFGRKLGFAPDVIHTFDTEAELGFEPTAVFQYSLKQRKMVIPNPVRAAIVATTKESEYIGTVFKTFNHATNLEMRVFFSEASARSWLARE